MYECKYLLSARYMYRYIYDDCNLWLMVYGSSFSFPSSASTLHFPIMNMTDSRIENASGIFSEFLSHFFLFFYSFVKRVNCTLRYRLSSVRACMCVCVVPWHFPLWITLLNGFTCATQSAYIKSLIYPIRYDTARIGAWNYAMWGKARAEKKKKSTYKNS